MKWIRVFWRQKARFITVGSGWGIGSKISGMIHLVYQSFYPFVILSLSFCLYHFVILSCLFYFYYFVFLSCCLSIMYSPCHFISFFSFYRNLVIIWSVVMLSVVMLNVIILKVIMLNFVMHNVIMLNVVIRNVIMLNVVIQNVMAPQQQRKYLT